MAALKLVYLEWDDAGDVDTSSGWVFRKGAPKVTARIFRHVGFVTEETADHIVLTCAYDSTQMAPRTRIPIGMVRRRVDLSAYVKAP